MRWQQFACPRMVSALFYDICRYFTQSIVIFWFINIGNVTTPSICKQKSHSVRLHSQSSRPWWQLLIGSVFMFEHIRIFSHLVWRHWSCVQSKLICILFPQPWRWCRLDNIYPSVFLSTDQSVKFVRSVTIVQFITASFLS